MLSVHSDLLAQRLVANAIHLYANGEKQNGFPFPFGYQGPQIKHGKLNKAAIPKNTKRATKFGLTVF